MIHLRDPMLALERLAALCGPGSRLIFTDEYSPKLDRLRWLGVRTAAEFLGESPWMTWWRPASRTWVTMIRCAGFEDARIHGRFNMGFRAERGGVPHVVVHADGPKRERLAPLAVGRLRRRLLYLPRDLSYGYGPC